MTEPEKTPTHGEIILDVVRSGYSPLGDKTWTMQDLADRTGLRPYQVSNAIARIAHDARQANEEPIIRTKTGAKGQYIYWGPLKRGRKKNNGVRDEDLKNINIVPTEEVPFTDEELADENTVVIVDVPVRDVETEGVKGTVTGRLRVTQPPLQNVKPPTLAEGFAQIGEKMHAAFGDLRGVMGVTAPRASTEHQAVEAEKAAGREKAVRNNKVGRVRRLMNELALEMRYLENEWDALVEKGRRYDKLTMTMFGFSSNDPAAVDALTPEEWEDGHSR